MRKVFLSHKTQDVSAAEALRDALSIVFGRDEIFLAEEINKGDDWREEIDRALKEAECFLLLYTDPQLDWSWSFYEAGAFAKMEEKPGRPVFCLHPSEVVRPSPLANLQTIQATPDELEPWIRNDLCQIARCRQPSAEDIRSSFEKIGKLIKETSPYHERVLKPFIWIEPSWPVPDQEPNWNDVNALSDVDFSHAVVSIDDDSAVQLGFVTAPTEKKLLPFLRELACDAEWSDKKVEFWISKFFESLRDALKGHLYFQETAYFRHESGRILRPVVVSYAKNSSGTKCKLRVIFASAFGSPLTDNPSQVQRLSDGIRLAVRTRLEVLDPFLGRMSQVHDEKVLSKEPRDEIARSIPVGARVTEALDTILQEALAHGVRSGGPAPKLFEGPAQREYEKLRDGSLASGQKLMMKAKEEDQKGTGEYPETEQLLDELNRHIQAYLGLSLPRLRKLLAGEYQ
jgi:hypothetical protein